MRQKVAGITLGLLIIAGIVFIFWFLFTVFSPEAFLAYVAGLSPAIAVVYWQIRREKTERSNWLLRNEEAYLSEFVDLFFTVVHSKEAGKFVQSNKFEKRIQALQPALLMWASPGVLIEWNEFQRASMNTVSSEDAIRNSEKFFRSLRKELGHDDTRLPQGLIMASFLKDKEAALNAFKRHKPRAKASINQKKSS